MGIYKIKNIYYIDYYHDGQRVRKSIGPSKRDAENALTAARADILRGQFKFKKDRKIRFDEFSEKYLEYSKANKRSWSRDVTSLNNLLPFFGNMLLSKISPRNIEDYKNERLKHVKKKLYLEKKERSGKAQPIKPKGEKPKLVKPATINRELALLKNMFTKAMAWKYIDENPAKKDVRMFQERQTVMRILEGEEIQRLIDSANGYLKTIVILALNTGMRRTEILKLRWNDIDFIDRFIFVKETKSNVPRKIPMNDLVYKTLKEKKQSNEFVFYNPKTRNRIKDIKTAFKTLCSQAEIKGIRFHDLRHTAATLMIMKGVDLVTVKEILGHASINTTMRYAHPTPENKRRAVHILGEALVHGWKKPASRKGEIIGSISNN